MSCVVHLLCTFAPLHVVPVGLQHSAEVVSNVLDDVLCPDVGGELNTPTTTSNPTQLRPHVSGSLHPSTNPGDTEDDPSEVHKDDDQSEVHKDEDPSEVHKDEVPSKGHSEEEPSHPDQSSNATVVVYVAHVKEDPEEEIYSRKWIFFSLFTVFCVLFVAGIVVAIVLQRKFRWIKSSYKPRKYKFVGSFFPSGDAGTYIPPTGTPKVPGAEQCRLLDSDEEEV